MTLQSPEEHQAAIAAAAYQEYLDGVAAADQRAAEVAEFNAAVENHNAAGKRQHALRAAALDKFTISIEKDVTDLYAALNAADNEVGAAKAIAMAKGLTAHGKGGFALAEFGGSRLGNITAVTRIVEKILTKVTG